MSEQPKNSSGPRGSVGLHVEDCGTVTIGEARIMGSDTAIYAARVQNLDVGSLIAMNRAAISAIQDRDIDRLLHHLGVPVEVGRGKAVEALRRMSEGGSDSVKVAAIGSSTVLANAGNLASICSFIVSASQTELWRSFLDLIRS